MPSKGASELNQAEKDRQIEEKIRSQINGIKALIQQNIADHIPQEKQEEIEVLGITYDDYVPLGKVDYKGLNCVVHYARKTYDEQGNSQILQEHMVFSLDKEGNIVDSLAKVNEEGLVELTPEFEEKLKNAQNSELVKEQDDKHYLVREDGKLKTVDEEEKTRMQDKEEAEKEEIAQSYKKMRGEKEDERTSDDILSITEIEDPSTFAKVLEVPLENVRGKYKLVRFKGDYFILVDDKNQVKAGLEISELAADIHRKLNIRPEDENARIRAKDLEPASTEPGRYNVVKIKNPNLDDMEIMISYSTTADSEVHLFERDEKGDLRPVQTDTKYPPKLVENGNEANILPSNRDMAKLLERQEKLEKALELQKTIEVYQGKTHVVEAMAGMATGAIEGVAVGTIVAGSPEAGATIGAVTSGVKAYKASKANAEETIEECKEQRDKLLGELDITKIEEAEKEADEGARYLGDNLGRYGY